MKFFALFICFYFSALTVIPTVKVMKEHFVGKCQTNSEKSTTSNSHSESGCHKDKCLLNLVVNNFNFVVFTQLFVLKTFFYPFEKLEETFFRNNLISHYNVSIWQPPE